MKGRRKAKTQKWALKARFLAEARERLGVRCSKQSKFLNIAAHSGRELEPVGSLAGVCLMGSLADPGTSPNRNP